MWGADGGGSPLRKSQEGQPPRIMLPSCAGGRVLPALPRLLDQSPQVLRILFEIRPGFGLGPCMRVRVQVGACGCVLCAPAGERAAAALYSFSRVQPLTCAALH